jgi:stringent starvation protein B
VTSTRPYLIRAFYDWIVDNNCTPHIVVNATLENVMVPTEYIDNGQIVLNIAVSAVQALVLGDEAIEFQARFGGRVNKIYAPVSSILAIYAKENGRGMVFAEEEGVDPPPPKQPEPKDKGTIGKEESKDKKGKGGKGSHLTLVK